jgi:hypothetical protein
VLERLRVCESTEGEDSRNPQKARTAAMGQQHQKDSLLAVIVLLRRG